MKRELKYASFGDESKLVAFVNQSNIEVVSITIELVHASRFILFYYRLD